MTILIPLLSSLQMWMSAKNTGMPSAAHGGARTAWAPIAVSWAASPASTGHPWVTALVSTALGLPGPHPGRNRVVGGHLCQRCRGEGGVGRGGNVWLVERQIMLRVCFLGCAACLCLDFSLPGIWNRHCIVLLPTWGESWAGYSHSRLEAEPGLPVSCACWGQCQSPAWQARVRGKVAGKSAC